MRLFPAILSVLLLLLISPANAQDLVKGFNAYRLGDYANALRELRPLAERDNVLAQYKVATMYNNGEGVRQSYTEAVQWLQRAAALGYAPAQCSLGVKYEKGQGVKRNYSEAVKWYRYGAEQGYDIAQYRLGRMYVLGHGVRRNYTEAVAWFDLAAEQGVEDAASARDAVAARLTPQQLAAAERKSRKESQ